MNTIDTFEIMYSSDGSVIPEFASAKHIFTPGRTYAHKNAEDRSGNQNLQSES